MSKRVGGARRRRSALAAAGQRNGVTQNRIAIVLVLQGCRSCLRIGQCRGQMEFRSTLRMKVDGREAIIQACVLFANGRRKRTRLSILVLMLMTVVKGVIRHGGSLGRPVTDLL